MDDCSTDECFQRRRSDDWWPDETTKEKEAECRCRKVRPESRRKSCRSLRSRGDQDFRMRSGNKIRGRSKNTCSNRGEGGVLQNNTECHSGGRGGIRV